MSGKPKQFPLSLASVVDQGSTVKRTKLAMPQTAVQNAARDAQRTAQISSATGLQNRSSSNNNYSPKPGANTTSNFAFNSSINSQPVSNSGALVSDKIRQAMVGRVAQQGVKDKIVLAAMEAIPRHLFIESGLWSQAYIDASLPIGHHQTISQPYIVARMIEILKNGKSLNNVMEIGTGCGYQAAVLSLVAKNVYSIERIKALHELAKNNLRPMRIANIRLHYGDGMIGLPQIAPFDGIILAAAGLEVPPALLEQLVIGGRLIAPVGNRNQVLQLIERRGVREWHSEILENCHFVPLHAGVI
jgi:protein-L-isoaspartate(D-aspartate) O-methyltransferase